MAQPAGQIVGRNAELGWIEQALAELRRGSSGVLAIAGEPGIGKTRLLAELVGRAAGRGFLTLGGSASELEADLPFWVFVDALDEHAGALDPRRLESLDADLRAELARVFPSLAGLADGVSPGPAYDAR